jgi:tetratricopeptide (TPR) repeat protein
LRPQSREEEAAFVARPTPNLATDAPTGRIVGKEGYLVVAAMAMALVVLPVPAAAGDAAARPHDTGAAARAAASAVRKAQAALRDATLDPTDSDRVRALERIAELRRAGRNAGVAELLPLLHDDDRRVRDQAERAIWAIWSRSGSDRLDRLYRSGVAQLSRRRLSEATRTFSRVIAERPDFAEAWNKRATARYLAGDFEGALADGRAVLERVPDHFGTLAGFGHIYFRLEEPDRAVAYWRRALIVNPNLESVQRSLDAVERTRPGRPRIVI